MTASRPRLFLHAGLPKAASSSLQRWCASNRGLLQSQGIVYPETEPGLLAPKHEFLVAELLSGQSRSLAALIDAHPGVDLMLSTEGLTYRFDEFRQESLAAFREALRPRDVQLIVVTRDFASWSRSLYAQAILNRPGPERSFAGGLSFDEFRKTKHVLQLGDCTKRLAEYQAAFGASHRHVFDVAGDWFGQFCRVVGLCKTSQGLVRPVRENQSASPEIIEIARQVNAMSLADETRSNFLAFLREFTGSSHNALLTYRMLRNKDAALGALTEVLARVRPNPPLGQAKIEQFATFCSSFKLSDTVERCCA